MIKTISPNKMTCTKAKIKIKSKIKPKWTQENQSLLESLDLNYIQIISNSNPSICFLYSNKIIK